MVVHLFLISHLIMIKVLVHLLYFRVEYCRLHFKLQDLNQELLIHSMLSRETHLVFQPIHLQFNFYVHLFPTFQPPQALMLSEIILSFNGLLQVQTVRQLIVIELK